MVVSIDFKIVPFEKAVVSVMDRGFLYGDSIYEVVRTYDGSKPFLFDEHAIRLQRSADRIGLPLPFSNNRLRSHVDECLLKAKQDNAYVRIIVSRGLDNRFDLFPQKELHSKTVILVTKLPVYPKEYFENGIRIALVSIRRNLRSALDPNIKSGNYLNNVMGIMEARKMGAVDAVMLNHNECVTEATTSNLFMVKKGTIVTPDVESGILEGISRSFLRKLIQMEGIPFEERAIPKEEFLCADEIFITSTLKEIMPVRQVDEVTIGDGTPGPVTRNFMKLFRKAVEQELAKA